MDQFSSQTALGFEDRIRQMLSSDKPNVRLPPRVNLPQQAPPGIPLAGSQTAAVPWGAQGAGAPLPPQLQTPPPGMMPPGPPPPSQQFAPPHLRYQGNHGIQPNQAPPPGPRHQGSPAQYRAPHQNAQYPHGQRPQHPRGPVPQHNGQYQRGHQQSQHNGPHWQQRQQPSLDPNAFSRGGAGRGQARPALFDPNARSQQSGYMWNDARQRQTQYLEQVVEAHVPNVDMSQGEREEKDSFRETLDRLCQKVCEQNPKLPKVKLECFGSFASGFASAGSDMDLVIVVQDQEASSAVFSLLQDDLPRSLEDALLRAGYGARLLTRTRVPIIKVCQSPIDSFLDKLRAEREKWDLLPNEKKYPHLFKNDEDDGEDDAPQSNGTTQVEQKTSIDVDNNDGTTTTTTVASSITVQPDGGATSRTGEAQVTTEKTVLTQDPDPQHDTEKREQVRTWTRERKAGPLDFPKEGVGIQCDINFFNPLGLHNTQMLRCYSLCDPRVRPIVLFVKAWAKLRRINSSYSGTLSSYGYVMMVLHYLMNVAQPAVIPNLQLPWRPNVQCTPQGASKTMVDEWMVDFWRNEDEIQAAVRNGQMSANRESIGSLLAGFFQYYSSMGNGPQFRWTTQVLSLRTPGGIMTKEEKGWVKATTEEGEGKKIQHRYLFAIEDPFELTHNVARTVTHNGIVAIRDEFRRAQRILYAIGGGHQPRDGELFTQLIEAEDFVNATAQLKLDAGPAPVEAVKQWPEQKQHKKPANKQTMDGAVDKNPRKPAPKQQPQQQKKRLDMADQDAFPTLGAAGAASSGKRGNRKRGGHKSSSNGEQAQAELANKKAEAQGEETAHSAVEFLGL